MSKQEDVAKVTGEGGPLVDQKIMDEVIKEKLLDAETPGFQAEFDPLEAQMLGAFEEDALSEADALNSCIDWHPDEDLS